MRLRLPVNILSVLLSSPAYLTYTDGFQSNIQRLPASTQHQYKIQQAARSFLSRALHSRRSDYQDDRYSVETLPSDYVKYEMISLPDSMVDTTVFIGNLCEFVTDDMLSDLLQEVSILGSIPSVVARKPNTSSLKYGFASFPSVKEKDAAISKFNGFLLNGRPLKIENIERKVRVPGKLVEYIVGTSKNYQSIRRISRDDVERLSRGQPSKKNGMGSRGVPHRLNESEREEFLRAANKGYLTLDGTGWRRGRKGSPLGNSHRQWCDARAKPQILLCRASAGRMLDNVIVDFSPLRIGALSSDDSVVNSFLVSWKIDVLTAAENAGMVLVEDYEEDNNVSLSEQDETNDLADLSIKIAAEDWSVQPIWRLPTISIGVFEGERSKAKTMAKELAVKWKVMDDFLDTPSKGNRSFGAKNRRTAGAKRGGKTKMKGLSRHRQSRKNDKFDYL